MGTEPAELAFASDGTPYSSVYGDVYHSAQSGSGQARHVFIGGSGLPQRWARARVFTILETGFGTGLNFLATWRQWRDDPARCGHLHYVSIEKHPFGRGALAELHARHAEYAPLAQQLQQAWPPLVAGMHRLQFEGGQLTLTLAFADVAAVVPRLRLRADAIYLDGFAPRLNPDMWSPRLLRKIAQLSRPGATVATYSSAAPVRQALQAAGFTVEKRPGFGRKREMLCGTYAPRRPQSEPAAPGERHAMVIGAGVAGAAVVGRLAQRGWSIDLIESRDPTGAQAAARYAGVFHPHVSIDDCILSRATRNGFLHALRQWRALDQSGQALAWSRCGVLQLAEDAAGAQRLRAALVASAFPADFARHLERGEAEALAGCALAGGGAWFAGAGWIRPTSLVAAQLAAAGAALRAHFGVRVERIARDGGRWQAFAADGSLIAAAPVLVLANSNDAARLAPLAQPLQSIRGQMSYLPTAGLDTPRIVLTGAGYALPAMDGMMVIGSTYDRDDDDPAPQLRGHEANLARLAQLLPQARPAVAAAALEGAVGFRCAAPDHLPLVGAVPDMAAALMRKASLTGAHLADLPRREGLYCATAFASRGLVWSALAGELLASLLENEALALEGDLADALDPGRFVLRRARRGAL